MHHALEIQEILLNIFSHFDPLWRTSSRGSASSLAALARTCRAFKEPALDALWKEVGGLSPLFRRFPEAFRQVSWNKYSFIRPLTESEWDILRSYTSRIRSIRGLATTLDEKSLGTFLNPPTTDPLFPNLCSLCYHCTHESIPLLQLRLPSLISLQLACRNTFLIREDLRSLLKLSPNIKTLSIRVYKQEGKIDRGIVRNYFCRWRSLQTLFLSSNVTFDMDSLVCLSRMSSLTRLDLALSGTLATHPPLCFPYLHDLTLHSRSLAQLTWLFSQTQLPVVTRLSVTIDATIPEQDLTPFFASVWNTNATHTVEALSLSSRFRRRRPYHPQLVLENLRSCIAFDKLRRIFIEVTWNISLTDDDLLTLASAWPRLEEISINADRGWNTLGGITPSGLLQFLQTCRFVNRLALAINTQRVDEIPRPPEGFGLRHPRMFSINVVDSEIGPEAVSAMATFFAGIAHRSEAPLITWLVLSTANVTEREEREVRWKEVRDLVHDTINRRSHTGTLSIE